MLKRALMIPCCWPISSNGCYSWTVSTIIPVSLPQVLSMAKQTWPKVQQNAATSQTHEWVNRITSRWPVAFIFPGLDQPLFALMRTVVTYNSFLWRAKVQLCCLSEDHHGSNSKVKAALGEQEFTRDGKQPVWKTVSVKGQKVIFEGFFVLAFALHTEKPSVPKPRGCSPLCCWVQALAICLYLTFPIEGIIFKYSLIVKKSRVLALRKHVKINFPGTTLSW